MFRPVIIFNPPSVSDDTVRALMGIVTLIALWFGVGYVWDALGEWQRSPFPLNLIMAFYYYLILYSIVFPIESFIHVWDFLRGSNITAYNNINLCISILGIIIYSFIFLVLVRAVFFLLGVLRLTLKRFIITVLSPLVITVIGLVVLMVGNWLFARETPRVDEQTVKERLAKDKKDFKTWGKPLDYLFMMGHQAVFPPKYRTFGSYYAARGKLALDAYAKEKGLKGLNRQQLFESINQDFENYITNIQTCLKYNSYYQGSLDGKLGPQTKKAITSSVNAKLNNVEKIGWMDNSDWPTQGYKKYLKHNFENCSFL